MFIDIVPGTPAVYREDVMKKLFGIGYKVSDNIMFGSDNIAHDYNVEWVREWEERDRLIYKKIGLDEETVNKIFIKNLERFLEPVK